MEVKDNRAKQLLRDKALHLYGDMVRFSLRQRWFSGLPTTRIEVYLLSRSVWPLTLLHNQLNIRDYYAQLRWIERRFHFICRSAPNPTDQDMKSNVFQILKSAREDRIWREEHDPLRYHQRLNAQDAVGEVKKLLQMNQSDVHGWDAALSEAKKRVNQCRISVRITDDQYMAVMFLGQELANYYLQTLNQPQRTLIRDSRI